MKIANEDSFDVMGLEMGNNGGVAEGGFPAVLTTKDGVEDGNEVFVIVKGGCGRRVGRKYG